MRCSFRNKRLNVSEHNECQSLAHVYTVAKKDGESRLFGLSLEEAAAVILSKDGHTWSLRRDTTGTTWLYTSWLPQNSAACLGERKRGIYSVQSDPTLARHEIFEKLIELSQHPDVSGLEAMLQDEYKRLRC